MAKQRKKQNNSIAIIGMGCVFPGAHTPEALWENLLAGRRFFRRTPSERLPIEDYYDPSPDAPGKTYSDQMAVITDWNFDPIEFRIPPVTFEVTDMAHWLALDTAKQAVSNAGLDLETADRDKIGVVLGNSLAGEFSRSHYLRFRWPFVERTLQRVMKQQDISDTTINGFVEQFKHVYEAPLPDITEDSLAGNMSNTIAGRICNYFDFGGCGYTVDGACSSSLLSIATACNALVAGDMKIALAGGVDISLDPFEIVGFAKTQALAKEDIRPYDENAAGMLTGEGCGILVLMKEQDAIDRGYNIHALIKGWGYSSDGAGGITAPEVEGQKRALQCAYERAGYPISSVGLIEGHGTGTTLGDKVELNAVISMLNEEAKGINCRIGSIKGNIGHCKAAAGVAGMIKAVMALKHKVFPPTTNCNNPNPIFKQSDGKLSPVLEGGVWEYQNIPRRASVSAMGFGGSNSHITIEEVDAEKKVDATSLSLLCSKRTTELILLAGDSPHTLDLQVKRLLPIAAKISRAELTDMSAALLKNSLNGKLRLAIIADSPWNLHRALLKVSNVLQRQQKPIAFYDPLEGIYLDNAKENPSLVALFPGQGAQYVNMCSQLANAFPFIKDFLQNAEKKLKGCASSNLSDYIFKDSSNVENDIVNEWSEDLAETQIAQPAIVYTSLALLKVLNFFGIKPDICIGHSLGEISAMSASGAFDDVTAVKLAALRGEATASLELDEPGTMIAISLDSKKVDELIKEFRDELVVANYNSPVQTVVSGTLEAVDKLAKICDKEKIRYSKLNVSHAFHSKIVAPASDVFMSSIKNIKLKPLSTTLISTCTGDVVPENANLKSLLSKQIGQPVKFIEAINNANKNNPSLWMEVGPKGILTGLLRSILGENNPKSIPGISPGENCLERIHTIIAQAFVTGLPVDTDKLFEYRFHQAFSLDNYDPDFIVNPCERPVDLEKLVKSQPLLLSDSICPAGVRESNFQKYLSDRTQQIQDFIFSDYQKYADENDLTEEEPEEESGSHDGGNAFSDEDDSQIEFSREEILDYAIEWIVKRTGFPKSSITPEMKLRDDLNLDSIKVGELVLMICQKLKREAPADTSVFANSPVDSLIDVISSELHHINLKETSASSISDTTNLPEIFNQWINTFQVERTVFPISSETVLHFPHRGKALIIGDPENSLTEAIVKRFASKGLTPNVINITSVNAKDITTDITVFVVILPPVEKYFLDQAPEEFDAEVELHSKIMFNLFKWIGLNRDTSWKNLRVVFVRTTEMKECNSDYLDAGKAFLKTMRLEHSAVQTKWLTIPASWTPDKSSETIENEIVTTGERVGYFYDEHGTRLIETASPLDSIRTDVPQLTKDDIVLVTGGAKGITFELARTLALKTNVKLVLMGTSPLPDETIPPDENEMVSHFRQLDQDGIEYSYLQCDVTDFETVSESLDALQEDIGEVSGIIHGAGISQLIMLQDMDWKTFARTLKVKINGLYNLLTSIPVEQLKILHIVSSVLGKTGMRGQADYTFANNWLDGALQTIYKQHPTLHALSLGYSVWSETGLGKKLGAVDSLTAAGVTPMDTDTGICQYNKLLNAYYPTSTFIINGRLGPELERNLYPPIPETNRRFLRKILSWIPQTEIVAESLISHKTDFYLPEHVFDGTPIFPAVMAIEAMVQAASYLTKIDVLPILENLSFHRPIIVREDSEVKLRVFAVIESSDDNKTIVFAGVRADSDSFQENYFTAKCIFGCVPSETELPTCPDAEKTIEKTPEEFSPHPLFQGKFLRRISAINQMDYEDISVTEVEIPDGDIYFDRNYSQKLCTSSPASRDSYLQSGLLIIPPGSLPFQIERISFFQQPTSGSHVICRAKVMEKIDKRIISDITVFTKDGKPVEEIKGLETQATETKPTSGTVTNEPITLDRIQDDLTALLYGVPHAISITSQSQLESIDLERYESRQNLEKIIQKTSEPRKVSVLCNLIAAKTAAVEFAGKQDVELNVKDIILTHDASGKPMLDFAETFKERDIFSGMDISITDGVGYSVAFIAPAPVGIDIEEIEVRNSELWRGLLNDDGYSMALNIANVTSESFDASATRVWTLVEAGKKANNLQRILPGEIASLGAPWYSFRHETADNFQEYLSVSTDIQRHEEIVNAILTVVHSREKTPEEKNLFKIERAKQGAYDKFQEILDEFKERMTIYKPLFIDDPGSPDTEKHHKQFLQAVENMMEKLFALQKTIEPSFLNELKLQMRQKLTDQLLEFLDGSDVFKHAIVKPFGYAGDFLMLDKLVQENSNSIGLAYHFDRSQLEYPASIACRNRIKWVGDELIEFVKHKAGAPLKILDIGIGAAPIERYLIEEINDISLELTAVDIEPACLEFVEKTVKAENRKVDVYRIDLRQEDAEDKLKTLAVDVDVCIVVGIIEALRDEEMIRVFSALFESLPRGTPLYTESFLPEHPTRPYMEWFMDFHLGYRSPEEVLSLVKKAGAKDEQMETSIDETQSLGFLKITI